MPVLLVGPSTLTPGQQRDLRRDLVRWSRERPVPVSELAETVAQAMSRRHQADVEAAVVGEGAWRAH